MNRMLHFHSLRADNKMRTFCNPIMIHVAHKSTEWGAEQRHRTNRGGKTIYRIKWAVGLLWCFTVEFPLIENNQRKWIGKLLTNTWLRTPFVRPPTTLLLTLSVNNMPCFPGRFVIWGWFVNAIEGCSVDFAFMRHQDQPFFIPLSAKARLLVVTLIRPLLGRGRLFNLRKFPRDDTLCLLSGCFMNPFPCQSACLILILIPHWLHSQGG